MSNRKSTGRLSRAAYFTGTGVALVAWVWLSVIAGIAIGDALSKGWLR